VFAQLTPPGEGGIAVFGLEGRGARELLAAAVGGRRVAGMRAGELAYGRLRSAQGEVLDEVIVACLRPRGNGTERFELNCHAGGAAAAAAARRLVSLGAEPGQLRAEPGADALEADFHRALAVARTRRQARALAAARGPLRPELARLAGLPASTRGVTAMALGLAGLVEESERLERLLLNHRVVLAGPTNAGKSTLFNRLAGADRSIASPRPGTTRDSVEVPLALRGLAVDLIDTAGLGPVARDDSLSARAQQLALAGAREADLCLLVLDCSAGGSSREDLDQLRPRSGAGKQLVVANKADLARGEPPVGALPVSALTGQGIDALLARLECELLPAAPRGRAAVSSRRALATLRRAYSCVRRGHEDNDPVAVTAAAGLLVEIGGAPS
jgi:tRNA modification GTPase